MMANHDTEASISAADDPARSPVRNRKQQVKSVVLVSAGNFLDMYDFMVFGYYAPWIGHAYFPRESEFASLMLTFAVFGAGFLMRPVGAVVLGAYVDRRGRRAGLIMTLALMAVGTLSIACTPGYATLGILAPILVLIGRLLQGFSAGAQVGSASVYLSEIATPGHKGFYVSWQSGSQQMAVVFAALLGITISSHLSPAAFASWGWRLPFFVGCLLIPLLFVLRRSLEETPSFLARKQQLSTVQLFSSLAKNWKLIAIGTMLVAMTTVAFYLITAYSPTYGNVVLHLKARAGLTVTLCVGIFNFVMLPIMGIVSDRVGRRPLLILCALVTLVTAYPMMLWLVSSPTFATLLGVELWLALLYSGYNGAMVVYLTEIIPVQVRTAGFSLAYSLATAVFGGFTPAICTYFIHLTGNKAIPGLWLSMAAISALIATFMLREHRTLLVRNQEAKSS
jgi:MFS transporter, MHS family, citrate/tricarballylate:H+ symporter